MDPTNIKITHRYFKVDGCMEKKWDTVIPADLKRLFASAICPVGHERVKRTTNNQL
jgi:hypothetical protein